MTILSRVHALIKRVKEFFYNRYLKPVTFETDVRTKTLIIPITDFSGIIYKGVTEMKFLTTQGIVAGDIILLDINGNPVEVEGVPQWTVGPQGIVNVIPSENGKSAKIEATGVVGQAQVTVFANGISNQFIIETELPVVVPDPIITPPTKPVAVTMSVPLSAPYDLQGQQIPVDPVQPAPPAPDAPVVFSQTGDIVPQQQQH